MDNVLVSRILYLDKNYQPCGTRVIRRPGIKHHNDRFDSKNIMAVGIGAFDDGDFERVPCYWVSYAGNITNFDDMHICAGYNVGRIEQMLAKHFRFTALHEVGRKVERIKSLLGFLNSYRPAEFVIHEGGWVKENQVVVSLYDNDHDWMEFSIGDLLYSLHMAIKDCGESIQTVRRQIVDKNNDIQFIMHTKKVLKNNHVSGSVGIGDEYIDYDKFNRIIFGPIYNTNVSTIHGLKRRLQELERQRGYMQNVIRLIMNETWQAN